MAYLTAEPFEIPHARFCRHFHVAEDLAESLFITYLNFYLRFSSRAITKHGFKFFPRNFDFTPQPTFRKSFSEISVRWDVPIFYAEIIFQLEAIQSWEDPPWAPLWQTHASDQNPDNKELAHPHSRWTSKCWKLSETRPDQWPASVHLQALQGHRDISRWQKNRVSPLLSPRALSKWLNFSRRPTSPCSPKQVFSQSIEFFLHSEPRRLLGASSPILWISLRIGSSFLDCTDNWKAAHSEFDWNVNNSLISVNVHIFSPHSHIILSLRLYYFTHEFSTGINLKNLWPSNRSFPVNFLKSLSDFQRILWSEWFCAFESASDINDSQCILVNLFRPGCWSVMRDEKKISLTNRIWWLNIKG